MASSSFRDSINSLGWSRATDEPVNTSRETGGFLSGIQNLNPFRDRGYLQLPTHEASPGAPLPAPSRREEEEGWFVRESTPVISLLRLSSVPAHLSSIMPLQASLQLVLHFLSRWDRLLVFAACNLAALACFVICFTLFPIVATRPRKFVLLWTVGSGLFLASFAAVMGPMNYVYHLLSAPRLPFTAAYFGSIIMTLVFAIKLQNTILTLFSALVQLAALAWYLVSYFPMGSAGLRMATTFGARQATSWMSG